jgi:glycosyltransferase involved in cell wall biosynthesis
VPQPPVTIGVAAYNCEPFIAETLESILAQDYPNRKIVVSDNASTDRTGEIVRSFEARGVRYHRQPENLGPGENFNWILREAQTSLVAVYHGDDVYLPSIVSREVAFLLDHPEAGAVFALDTQIDEGNRPIGESRLPEELTGRTLFQFPETLFLVMRFGNNFLRCPSVMFRKEAFEAAGPFNEADFGSSVDLEMWFRINRRFPLGLVPEPLFRYRRSDRQHTHRVHHNKIEPWDHFTAIDRHLADVADRAPRKLLLDYADHKMNDIAVAAANLLTIGRKAESLALLSPTVSGDALSSAVRSPARSAHYLARLFLFASARLGFGKPAAGLLRKFL